MLANLWKKRLANCGIRGEIWRTLCLPLPIQTRLGQSLKVMEYKPTVLGTVLARTQEMKEESCINQRPRWPVRLSQVSTFQMVSCLFEHEHSYSIPSIKNHCIFL